MFGYAHRDYPDATTDGVWFVAKTDYLPRHPTPYTQTAS